MQVKFNKIIALCAFLSSAKAFRVNNNRQNSCETWSEVIARSQPSKWFVNRDGTPVKRHCAETKYDIFFCSKVCVIPDGKTCKPRADFGDDQCSDSSYCHLDERVCTPLFTVDEFDFSSSSSSFDSSSYDDFFAPDIRMYN